MFSSHPQGRIVICWEFRFQLFDLWPKNRCLGQAAQLPPAYLAALLELCGPRPPSEMTENYVCRRFSHICGMVFLYPSVFAFVICAEKFPVFVWGLEVQLISICPLSDIFIPAVRRLWESSIQSRRWSVEYVKTKRLSLFKKKKIPCSDSFLVFFFSFFFHSFRHYSMCQNV